MTAERPADVAALTDRCGQCLVGGGTTVWTRPAVCALPSGHGGYHRSDEGTEWGFTVRDDYADIKAAARAEGYEAGRAEVTAAVEALADEWAANAVRAPTAYTSAVVREVRAALAAAPTLATVRADAGRDALLAMADEIDRGPTFPLPPSVISALIRERAAVVGDDHA